ncbi:hypothetical protein MHYP_G00265710 [Metynnis hypsauchen]
MDPEPDPGTSSSFLPPTKDSKFLRFFQKTAEELVGWLAYTTDSTTTGTKKWKKLRARISSFVRRVFCCGCRSSRRLVPL